ncbi:MAG: right-handed parallel beta-helix repeat-containing protein [Planctomycetota bacterium]
MRPTIYRRTGSRARCLVALGAGLVLAGAAGAEITLEEAVTVFDGDLATATMPQIQGGTDQTYVLVIATESDDDVTDVSDTLSELNWAEQKEQCGVGSGTGIRLWTTQGSPSGAFQVQITHAVAGMDLTAVLARYSGVGTIEDATSENTNGESGNCSGTAKSTTAQLTLTSTQNQSVHVVGVCPVQSFINSFSSGYELIDKGQQGRAYTFVYEGVFDTAATDTFQATVNGAAVKWSTAGIVLNPIPTTNYRSIGRETGILAQTGTATSTSGSSVVTFSDTLPTNIGTGDKLTVGSGGPATMFSDDFSDGVITGWTHAWGEDTLSESSSALRATSASTNSHYTVDGGSGWTDYTLTCDIKSHDDDETGISFRAQDGDNYYLFYQNFGNPGGGQWELSLEKYVAGTPTDLATPIDHEGVVDEEVWYTLKVEVSGTSIKCYFDDVLKFDITDETYSDGTVGAWCLSQECRWDNMLVTGNDDGIYHILSRDDDNTVTVQETAAGARTNETFKIERVYSGVQALQDWEDDRQADLVTLSRREVGVCYNDDSVGPFINPLVVNGSTTDETHYMMLTVASGQRHNGIAGAGARLDAGGGFSTRPISVKDPYTRIEWLEITNWLDDHSGVYFDESPAEDNADNSSVSNLLLHNFFTGTSDSALHFRADNVTAQNTIIYDGDGEGIRVRLGTGHVIDNCTIYGIIGDGVYQLSGTGVSIRNTICVGNTSDDFDLQGTVDYFDYNMYDTLAGLPAGANDQSPPADPDDLFVSIAPGSEDLHLETTGHSAGNTGLDLSTDFTTDIDGETRIDPWDLGADEAIFGTGTPRIISWKEVEP